MLRKFWWSFVVCGLQVQPLVRWGDFPNRKTVRYADKLLLTCQRWVGLGSADSDSVALRQIRNWKRFHYIFIEFVINLYMYSFRIMWQWLYLQIRKHINNNLQIWRSLPVCWLSQLSGEFYCYNLCLNDARLLSPVGLDKLPVQANIGSRTNLMLPQYKWNACGCCGESKCFLRPTLLDRFWFSFLIHWPKLHHL